MDSLQQPEGLTLAFDKSTLIHKKHPFPEGKIPSHFIYMMYLSILFIHCLYILIGINHLSFLDFFFICLPILEIVNRATLYTFVFLTK